MKKLTKHQLQYVNEYLSYAYETASDYEAVQFLMEKIGLTTDQAKRMFEFEPRFRLEPLFELTMDMFMSFLAAH